METFCLEAFPCEVCESRSTADWCEMFGHLRDVLHQREPPSPPRSDMSKSSAQRKHAAAKKYDKETRHLDRVLAAAVSPYDTFSFLDMSHFVSFLGSGSASSAPGSRECLSSHTAPPSPPPGSSPLRQRGGMGVVVGRPFLAFGPRSSRSAPFLLDTPAILARAVGRASVGSVRPPCPGPSRGPGPVGDLGSVSDPGPDGDPGPGKRTRISLAIYYHTCPE